MQAEDVERLERDDATWVRFTMEVETASGEIRRERIERPLVRNVRIKRPSADADRRVVVEIEFCLAGDRYRAEFSLDDRDGFRHPVLLGRRFLSRVAIVDAGATYRTTPDCDRDSRSAR